MSGNATLQEWNASAVEGADPLWPLAYADWIEEDTSRSQLLPEVTRKAIRKCPDLVEYVNTLKLGLDNWGEMDGVRFSSSMMFEWYVSFVIWRGFDIPRIIRSPSRAVPKEYHPVLNLFTNMWYLEKWSVPRQLTEPIMVWFVRALEMAGGNDLYLDEDMTVMEFYDQEGYTRYLANGVPQSLF